MPRQTSTTYYYIHKQLRHHWQTDPSSFSDISPNDQWYLHDYFQPSKDWSKQQLLDHRADITIRRPSLPHQAGRAYAKFQDAITAIKVAKVYTPHVRGTPWNISARGVLKPEPDVDKFAKVLLKIARQRHDEAAAAKQAAVQPPKDQVTDRRDEDPSPDA